MDKRQKDYLWCRAAVTYWLAVSKAKADAQRHLESISLWHPVGYVDGIVVYRRVF